MHTNEINDDKSLNFLEEIIEKIEYYLKNSEIKIFDEWIEFI